MAENQSIHAALLGGRPDSASAYLALSKSQFVPFFQPLVALRTGQVSGFEVLARWQHPTEGLIPPSRFIEAAEQDGWIDTLTQQVFEKAFAAASTIPESLTLAINVSPFQLRYLALPENIRRMAFEASFSLSRLTIEITETALIDDLHIAAEVVAQLKAMGCRLALDDFGTGYSSLQHLQCLPFDELKVDQRFVSSMMEKQESRKIVLAVVGLGQSLGLITVAEGIQTQGQADMLDRLGCELGQGFFYGRPVSADELAASVAASRRRTVSLKSKHEERRHQALLDLEILDTPAEAEFDDLVALASEICNAPISLVSLVDSERQWFKASVGLTVCETPIHSSFCAHAIEQKGLFLIEDATKDQRFKANPLVLDDPRIRFYAGMPLYAGEGVAVGTLCVLDTEPRSLSPGQARALDILSQQVQARMVLRSEQRKLMRAIKENRELTVELKHSNQILEYANAQLERMATIDSLTGILNRRAFEARMNSAFSEAVPGQRTLSLIVMDVDNFKKRNDQFGHVAGDEALRRVGEVLNQVLRAQDSAARTGGEEFAIILPDTKSDEACQVARRIQKLLRSVGGGNLPEITMSMGVACFEYGMTKWETLFSHADDAMYEAKQSGKNRLVVHFSEAVA